MRSFVTRVEATLNQLTEELSPVHHWMISSARRRTDWGIVRPRAFAVLRLITNSNLVGCSMGRSARLTPFKILSTKLALRRNMSGRLVLCYKDDGLGEGEDRLEPAEDLASLCVSVRDINAQLRIAATSTGPVATLQVYVTSTGELIGTLKHYDGNKYSGRFTRPVNPQNTTAQSSLCGSGTKAVTSK